MSTIKMTVTFYCNGEKLHRDNQPSDNVVKLTERDIDSNKRWLPNDGYNIVETRHFRHHNLVQETVNQVINMTEEAYQAMISNICPEWYRSNWNYLSKEQKITAHLNRIASDLSCNRFDYNIYDN